MVYLVLGMHKSGTTLITQTLHMSGINMGHDLKEHDLDYKTEKSESRTVRNINREILNSHSKFSLDVDPYFKGVLTADTENAVKSFITLQEKNYNDWGFKDPRTTQTYPHWRNYLPQHKLVLVYRPVSQVWHHYMRKRLSGLRFLYSESFRIGVRTIYVWTVYNKMLLEYKSKASPDNAILINYSLMLKDNSVLTDLEKFTNRSIVDCRSNKAVSPTTREKFIFLLYYGFCLIFRRQWKLREVHNRLIFETTSLE